MEERMRLEIEPKPSIFASMIDSGEQNTDIEKDCPMMDDSKILIPESSDLLPPANANVIKPNAGICVKVKSDKDGKVFINICHHSVVPHPASTLNINDLLNYSGESLFHFPLSLGELRTEKDKSGNDCKCFDVVINSAYYHQEILKKRHRDFILSLVASTLKEKYDVNVNIESYRILTKHYHCQMHDHTIKVESKSNAVSKASMISNMIASGAKYSDLKKNNIVDVADVTACETSDVCGMNKMCKLMDAATTISIRPNPGICAKTKTNQNEKIFINLCHHNAIPPPPPSMNIEAIMRKEEPMEFALSLGEIRMEKDKSGNECRCIDAVVNSDYYHEVISKNQSVRDYFLVLVCTGLGKRCQISVDVGALKVLAKPYHGEMPDHYLKFVVLPEDDKKSSLTESVSKDDIVMPVKDESRLIPFASPQVTTFKLFPKLMGEVSLLVFEGSVINVSDKNDLNVYLSKVQLTVEDKKANIILSVPIPKEYTISPEKGTSNLWNNKLTVAMPTI